MPKGFTRPLIDVPKVEVEVGLFSAIGGSYVVKVKVPGPKILIEKGPDGKFNYEFPPAPTSTEGSPSGEPSELPYVEAELVISDAELRIVDGDRETVFSNVSITAKVDTFQKPVAYGVSLSDPNV